MAMLEEVAQHLPMAAGVLMALRAHAGGKGEGVDAFTGIVGVELLDYVLASGGGEVEGVEFDGHHITS